MQYKKFDLNQIYVRKEFRIDLFQKTVCKGFFLSESMRKRAKQILQLKNLKVSLCSTTDIFMFKTLTERPGDIDDCRQLAREEIDWKAMLTEIQEQIKAAKRPVWITYIGERLDLMQEEGLQIPIMAEIDRLREQFFEDLEKKLGKQ